MKRGKKTEESNCSRCSRLYSRIPTARRHTNTHLEIKLRQNIFVVFIVMVSALLLDSSSLCCFLVMFWIWCWVQNVDKSIKFLCVFYLIVQFHDTFSAFSALSVAILFQSQNRINYFVSFD